MITWADVIAIASELVEVGDQARAIILAHVNGALNASVFSNAGSLRLARIYLAAHLGTYSMPESTGISTGDVVSETVGGISRTYSAVAAASSGSNLDDTTYGSTYRGILRMQPRARLPRAF